MSARTEQSAALADIQDIAIKSAIDAVDMASLGLSCVQELRAVLRALVNLSVEHEVIHDLAKVGLNLADDRINTINCECACMGKNLAALKGDVHA